MSNDTMELIRNELSKQLYCDNSLLITHMVIYGDYHLIEFKYNMIDHYASLTKDNKRVKKNSVRLDLR